MTDYEPIKAALLGLRHNPADIPRVDLPGLYAFFLVKPDSLSGVTVPPSGLLYIGQAGAKSARTLHKRNHFRLRQSGGSSPRRSLGVLLKQQLQLQAVPRGRGLSEKDFAHYRFSIAGEKQLTEWMRSHLTYTFALAPAGNIKAAEECLIAELTPPLNLTHWQNPQASYIEGLRAFCCADARRAAGHTP